mmetsp:Transcript_10550/g.30138  ORF Transcript_10550/g.30138 Transcript_10550/m.30138 type:complete len:236 (+) Transcript_10550:699-1406(+)
MGAGGLVVHPCGRGGPQLGGQIDHGQQLRSVLHLDLDAWERVHRVVISCPKVADLPGVEHVQAFVARKLDEGGKDLATRTAGAGEHVGRDALVDRAHRVGLAAAGLPIHQHCGIRARQRGIDEPPGRAGIDLVVVDLLAKGLVKGEVVVVHEHVPHVRVHPGVVDHDSLGQACHHIELALFRLVRENRPLPDAYPHESVRLHAVGPWASNPRRRVEGRRAEPVHGSLKGRAMVAS